VPQWAWDETIEVTISAVARRSDFIIRPVGRLQHGRAVNPAF